MTKDRFFYHSFPRPKAKEDTVEKGCRILLSMIDNGLLITQESYSFAEMRGAGTFGHRYHSFQKRICFTELPANELLKHSETFGPYSLEWERDSLLMIGVAPVWYFTNNDDGDKFPMTGSSFMARLAEILHLLIFLEKGYIIAKKNTPDSVNLNITSNDKNILTINRLDYISLVELITNETEDISSLVSSLRAMTGLFYPTDNKEHNIELLGYYMQREWRIIGNILTFNKKLSNTVSEKEAEELINIDPDFFGKEKDFPTGKTTVASQCQYLKEFEDKHILESCNRIIVPDEVYETVFSNITNEIIKSKLTKSSLIF